MTPSLEVLRADITTIRSGRGIRRGAKPASTTTGSVLRVPIKKGATPPSVAPFIFGSVR